MKWLKKLIKEVVDESLKEFQHPQITIEVIQDDKVKKPIEVHITGCHISGGLTVIHKDKNGEILGSNESP